MHALKRYNSRVDYRVRSAFFPFCSHSIHDIFGHGYDLLSSGLEESYPIDRTHAGTAPHAIPTQLEPSDHRATNRHQAEIPFQRLHSSIAHRLPDACAGRGFC